MPMTPGFEVNVPGTPVVADLELVKEDVSGDILAVSAVVVLDDRQPIGTRSG